MKKLLSSLLIALTVIVAVIPAHASLPAGYTELEYIESTGTQYIDTGLTVDTGAITATATFAPTSLVSPTNHYSAIFGRNSMFQAGYWNAKAYIGSMPSDNDFFVVNKKTVVTGVLTTTAANSAYYVDGVSTGLKRNFATGETVLLLNSEASAQHAAIGKLYNFTAERNGSTIMNLVPARRESDGQVGMYDTVSGTFFTNAGTGEFIAAPEVLNPCRNLYNKANGVLYGYPSQSFVWQQKTGPTAELSIMLKLTEGETYTVQRVAGAGTSAFRIQASSTETLTQGQQLVNIRSNSSANVQTFTVPNGAPYVIFYVRNVYNANGAANTSSLTLDQVIDGFQIEQGSTATEYVPYNASCHNTNAIKIATTAYNTARFNPVKTDLNNAVATIREIVTKTINQTAAIASLQADKQTRPEDACPAGKKCLLVETEENGVIVPHWFPIIESPE